MHQAGSRKEKEEAEEERRLALEEKRKQQHAAGPYVSKDADCDYTIRLLLLGDSGEVGGRTTPSLCTC